jgi:hypothetical protein
MGEREVDMAESYSSRASRKMVEGDIHGAIGDFTAALELLADGWTRFLRGKAFLMIHNNDAARSDFQRAKELGIPIHHDIIDICNQSRTRSNEVIYEKTENSRC